MGTQSKPSALDGRSVVLPGESDLGTPTKPRGNHQPWTGCVLQDERDLGTQRNLPALDGRSVVLPGRSDLGTQRKPPAFGGC